MSHLAIMRQLTQFRPQGMIRNDLYNLIRLAAVVVTVLILLFQQYIPERFRSVVTDDRFEVSLYSETQALGLADVAWDNRKQRQFHCYHQPAQQVSCGFTLGKFHHVQENINFEAYTNIRIRAKYEGDAKQVRLYFRNFDYAYHRKNDYNSTKFMSLILNASELDGRAINIPFTRFSIAEWWAVEYNLNKEDARITRDNVDNIGLDFISAGNHTVTIYDIGVTGKWLTTETLYLSILLLWLNIIFGEGLVRFYRYYQLSKQQAAKLNEVYVDNYKLTIAQQALVEKASRDLLTGVLNRHGIEAFVSTKLAHASQGYGILAMDIDHFKRVNDNHGHDVGDQALVLFTECVASCVRNHDAFGRWGGEEFILICPGTNLDNMSQIAEKVRVSVKQTCLLPELDIEMSVSIGGTISQKEEKIEDAFKRADQALYQAKHSGRNRVVMSKYP